MINYQPTNNQHQRSNSEAMKRPIPWLLIINHSQPLLGLADRRFLWIA